MFISYDVFARTGVGPVRFGMSPAEVRIAMGGPPEWSHKRWETERYPSDGYHRTSFRIDYDGDKPIVNFIELSRHARAVDAAFRGISILQTKASDVVRLLSDHDRFDETRPDLGYAYVFPNLDLALWRESLPRSDDDADGQFFDTVAVAAEGYFREPISPLERSRLEQSLLESIGVRPPGQIRMPPA
jgi:hypothetical protein